MGNEKKINTISLENPLERAKGVKVDATALEKWIKTTQTNQKVILDPKQAKTNLEKAAQKNKPSLGSIPNNKTTAAAKGNAQGCSNFCRKPGFHILPLRYSVAESAPALHKNLGKNVNNIALTKHKYTVEMVNTGYIYALVKRQSGPMIWSGYIVNKQGFLSYFNPDKDKAPLSAPDFACQSGEHIMKAGLVTIEEIPNNQAKEVYLILTHAPMTKHKRDEYLKNADKFVSEGKWQKLGVANWRGGNTSQSHCFPISNVSTINKKEVYGKRLGNTQERFSKYGLAIACMAFYDPIGITRTLNDSRNIKAFGTVNSFLDKKENGTTNNHKLQTLNLVDNIEKAIKEKIIKTKFDRIDAPKNLAKGHFEHDSRIILTKEQRAQISKNIEERHEKSIDIFAQRTKAQIESVVDTEEALKKYQEHLNMNSVISFRTKIDNMSKTAFQTALGYQDDHYNWLTSKNLLTAIYSFDQTEDIKKIDKDKKNTGLNSNSNGFIFHVIIMDLMNGMTFLSKGQQLIDKWINEKSVKENNLYLRAYCFNNKKLITHYDQTFASSSDGVKTSFDASKQIFGVFKEADAAFDQWLEAVDGKSFLTQGEFKAADKMFYWMSLALNSTLKVFSDLRMKTLSVGDITGVSGNARNMHAVHLYYLRTGDLAKKVPLQSLFHNLEFNKAAENVIKAQNASYINPYVLSVGKEINLHVKSQPTVTKNRLLAIVAVFELLNFYFQYDAWESDALGKPEVSAQLAGSFLTLTSATLELLGERWSLNHKYTESAIAKTKLTAASLGTIGSFIGILVDTKTLNETNGSTLRTILVARLAGNFAIFVSQTLSLIGVALSAGITEQAKRRAIAYSSHAAIGFLTGARFVASANLVVIGTVAIELIAKKYFIDNELVDWCQKCAFYRADSTPKNNFYKNNEKKKYLTEQEELDEFIKAIGAI